MLSNGFVLETLHESTKEFRVCKHFDAVHNSEQIIASALYEGYKMIGDDGMVFVSTYHADGYSHYTIKNGEFKTDVISYPNVKDFDHRFIGELFNAYKKGVLVPVEVKEVYDFLKNKRHPNLETITLKNKGYLPYRTFDAFVSDVINYPEKYDEKIAKICEVVYGHTTKSRSSAKFVEDMVYYPDWLKVFGLETKRVSFDTWEVSGEVDGKILQMSVSYDEHSIRKYGPVGDIELAGKLVSTYVISILYDEFYKFAIHDQEYKFEQVACGIVDYLDHYSSYNFDVEGDCLVDIKLLLELIKDKHITANDVYAVVERFSNNLELSERYKRRYSYDNFFKWIETRKTANLPFYTTLP